MMATSRASRFLSQRLFAAFHAPGNSTGRRSFVSATSVHLEQRTMKLPGLGDSISEGTIVEWTASVGQAVKEGDVVAMVETDKVTVDIKAEIDGVVMEQFCAVDDTVEVGADLYKIDTEAEASVAASPESAKTLASDNNAAASEPTETISSTTTPSEPPAPVAVATKGPRQPSIHFLGKEGWALRRAGHEAPAVVYIPPMYGRPFLSEDEMEALETGGASMAPQVKVPSSGAVFG